MDDKELIAAHKRAKTQLKLVWRLGPLLVLGVLVLHVWGAVNHVRHFDSEAFASELEREARDAWPKIEYRLRLIGENLAPAMEKAILESSEKLGEEVTSKLEEELDAFSKEGETLIALELERSMAAEKLAQHRLIEKHLPELAQDDKRREKVVAHVNAAAARWGQEQFRKFFVEHVAALESIRKTLDEKFVKKSAGSDRNNGEEIVLLWLELFEETVANDNTVLGAEPEEDAKTKKRK